MSRQLFPQSGSRNLTQQICRWWPWFSSQVHIYNQSAVICTLRVLHQFLLCLLSLALWARRAMGEPAPKPNGALVWLRLPCRNYPLQIFILIFISTPSNTRNNGHKTQLVWDVVMHHVRDGLAPQEPFSIRAAGCFPGSPLQPFRSTLCSTWSM